MSTQENLDLVHQMYEPLNAQDLEAHHKYWTDDMIWHGWSAGLWGYPRH